MALGGIVVILLLIAVVFLAVLLQHNTAKTFGT